MNQARKRSCLLISYGPVPTPDYQTIEGGGMRIWGLAKGLQQNDVNVTVAVNESFPQGISEVDEIKLVNWRLDDEFIRLINSFDAVIVSYNAGDLSVFVADNITDSVQLLLDAYVPIYIEVSARKAQDIDTEYVNYAADVSRHNHALMRGDYFLTANDAQDILYTGVLSALGIINPYSYREDRIIQTPFGIHNTPARATKNPYKELGVTKDDFVVLWFGGIYPWFRIEEYLDAIRQLAANKSIKFVFVGGKNPFNSNPDLAKQYKTAKNFATASGLIGKQVFFVDWVDYSSRADWYKRADITVSINQPGQENKYSWRTRVMDFVWGDTVILTNGGDPLSDQLLRSKAAIGLDALSSGGIIAAIQDIMKNRSLVKDAERNLQKLKPQYYWHNTTKEISKVIKSHTLPYQSEQKLRAKIRPPAGTPISGRPSKMKRAILMPIKLLRYARSKGLVRTLGVITASTKGRLKLSGNIATKREPQFIFISHPIDNTGAPIVLLQIIEEYVNRYGSNRVRVIAPSIDSLQKEYLKKLGVTVERAVFGLGFRGIRLQLGLSKNDFVFMNTIAIYDNYRDFIFLWLKIGRLNHAHWFIHEDKAQIPVIHKEFLHKQNITQIAKLASSDRLSLYFPSKRTAKEYEKILGIENLKPIKLRVEVDKKYKGPRSASNFDTINFLLSGTASDGRKGQLLALAAFQHFVNNHYNINPKLYRNFVLHLVAVGSEDYVSQQIRWIGSSTLSNRVKFYEPMPKDDAMKVTFQCNTVICCSLNETFGLYIAEGMLMGHVLLRNNCAGVDEQLVDGENGYLIDHTNIIDIAENIEHLLNKETTPNDKLAKMSKKSHSMMSEFCEHTYIEQITQDHNA